MNEKTEAQKAQDDVCVVCGASTPYTKNTDINARDYYVEGAGQLCENCYKNIYA